MTDLSIYKLNRKESIIFYTCMAAAGMGISLLMYKNILFSVLMIPLAGRIKAFTEEYLADRRRFRYLAEFKDFLFMASTAIGAGRSMKDAIGEAIPSLANIHGPSATLVHDLGTAHERMETGMENDVSVLMEMADASGLEDVRDFVLIYSICKKSGASLINALNKAASVIMEKMSIEREIAELIKRKECEGMILLVMPILVILFLNMFAPDYIAPLYETAAGRVIMTLTVISTIGVYVLIRRITDVDI